MTAIDLQAREYGIHSLDSGYVRPRLDAIHLIVHEGRAAFVDTGTGHSVPLMLAALAHLGLEVDAVDYVILTHVHLDHAGGAGRLMQHLPRARLVVHPRGAPHMIAPAKLWAATVAVYGEERARHDYGELVPVARERVTEATDGFAVELAGRRLSFLDTPGHARHHICVHDHHAHALFTGDTFGLSYRELDRGGRAFIFPTTTPTQFDPEALRASVDRVLACSPRAIYLTHYSEITDIARLGADLHRLIDAHETLGLQWAQCDDRAQREAGLTAGVHRIVVDEARRSGSDEALWVETFVNDIPLNAQGLGAWLDYRNKTV
ncbi:MBL fold metallo-hydrolase [Panacagrimonas sp.]|uniref:MBL fold metallo-hydrolase n=1 Tax=Panacagrimonas sp. TaxID=2480088 RepID=UPI003B527E98